ncbi:acyl-CoA dehydrogenase family protein [Sporichthya sp.]|uniref:acyl-CoA dehydrogenase family protein n=1 Tax=Sporichthya sp. TaxID=65475 RepID=UPI0025D9EE7D|nr:acyl-CoA dehydrogenase family protein [Sporichthya sp.]
MIVFTEEQEDLRKAVRALCDERSPESEVRRLMDTDGGYDEVVWKQLAQMGLLGLVIPEEHGGAGATWSDVGIVLEETGRALLCSPYFSTVVLGCGALLFSDDSAAQAEYLPRIAAGALRATFAVTEDSGRWDTEGVQLAARCSDGAWALDGHKCFVLDGLTADLLLLVARTDLGLSLFAVDADSAGLTRTPLKTMDATRKQARLELHSTPAQLIGIDGQGWAVTRIVLDLAAAALAAEQVGGARKALETAVTYAKIRHQFGRPIGSFQAIKHACADMFLQVEGATSVAHEAVRAIGSGGEDAALLASLAKAYCSDAFFNVAAKNIQIHGGIGFTWEHPAHLYFKRAKTGQLLFGDSHYHRALLADRLGI